ncbi:MAG: CapA family protein [Chloroflexota bacterium]
MRVVLSGDALITREYAPRADSRLLELLAEADVRFTNMEMLFNHYQGTPAVEAGGLHLSASEAVARDLQKTGFNLFATANNHSLDFGTDGLLDHLNVIESLGMAFAGTGRALGEAAEPAFLDTSTGRVGLVSCASSFATGQRAGQRRGDFGGRPGLNPQRFKTKYLVTEEQFEHLKAIADGLGITEMNEWAEYMEFRQPLDDPDNQLRLGAANLFTETIYERAEETKITTEAHEEDLARNVASVKQAKRQADLVIVSIHAHEPDVQIEKPAEFIHEFAHACIDAGAGIVTGSGPHIMRGIEIYEGKPIFYSLGNLWFELETVDRLPADSYEMWKLDPTSLNAADFYDNALIGFQKDERYWECALPSCEFENGELKAITLHPFTLGYGEPRGRRGTPRAAAPEDAERILNYTAELSEPYGTVISVAGGIGRINF